MKISKKRLAKDAKKEGCVFVLAHIPEGIHRAVKSEAALRKVKIGDIVVEALTDWHKGLA